MPLSVWFLLSPIAHLLAYHEARALYAKTAVPALVWQPVALLPRAALDGAMNAPPIVFNRRLYADRRSRAAKHFAHHDFLHRRAMDDIVDRLETVKRDFPHALFSGAGGLIDRLTPQCSVDRIISMDAAGRRLPTSGSRIVADEEFLPLAPQSLNLFVSLLTLHVANDLVGALTQARFALKPDGLFIAAVFGEETLRLLRRAFYEAEAQITGGVSARITPFASVQAYGQALSRAGFALPVVDVDRVSVQYDEPMKLLRDLRGMGETRALSTSAAPLRREVLTKAMEVFLQGGGTERFEIVYLTGWAPDQSQQKPLRPGKGQVALEDAIKNASEE